jgi:hypothetical protein
VLAIVVDAFQLRESIQALDVLVELVHQSAEGRLHHYLKDLLEFQVFPVDEIFDQHLRLVRAQQVHHHFRLSRAF